MRLTRPRHLPGRARQAGLSIVELMVGVTIGLIVVAAASLLMSTQLIENRRLLTETQLQQDLRSTADIMTRELRRAGALPEVGLSLVPAIIETVWSQNQVALRNILNDASTSGSNTQVDFKYAPADFISTPPLSQFKLDSGVIKTLMPGAGAQALTDANVMTVTAFAVTLNPVTATAIYIPCPKPCPDGTGDCWPTFQVREVAFSIESRATRDPAVLRAIRSSTRLRNDNVIFNPLNAGKICPL